MKSKRNFFFGLAILAIYIITVVSYVLSLFAEYRTGPSSADFRFTELVRETSRNLKSNSPRSEAFSTAFLRSLGSLNDIAGIQLVEDGEPILSYPRNVSEIGGRKSSLIMTKSSNIKASDGSTVTLTAAIYLLKPSSIRNKGISALLVIMMATLCCIGYLIISSISSKGKNGDAADEGESVPEPVKADEHESEQIEIESTETESVAETPVSEEPSDDFPPADEGLDSGSDGEIRISEDDIDLNISLDLDIEDAVEGGTGTEDESPVTALQIASNITQEEYQALTRDLLPDESPEPEVQEEKKVLSPEDMVLKPIPQLEVKNVEEKKPVREPRKSVPEGLFSPSTGFCWEEYMIPRLDSELMRAAASDQDLALLSLSIPGLDWTSESGKAVSSIIQNTFRFRDMIFEYGDTGCTAIVQGRNGKQIHDMAENLHTDIIAELARRREYRIVSIGIANRSLRLISGTRLANESEQALLRAQGDTDSPIVEFRINFDKYREFIASGGAKTELAEKKNF
ncbi:MAG: GGDEF domain-containing protein [Treponema sp.]|nr:GGDEF domain-containing protein [Treponema sp.]